jgi:hypothetical protein
MIDKDAEEAALVEKAAAGRTAKRQENEEWARKAQGKHVGDPAAEPLPKKGDE